MRVGKILSIAVVSVAILIVLRDGAMYLVFWMQSHGSSQQNFAPAQGEQAVSPVGDTVLVSQTSGASSFLYRKSSSSGTSVRLTQAQTGIESEASFSHNGKLIVYAFTTSPDSKSAIWVVAEDGSNAHLITGKDEDALHPVFSPDDSKIYYASSNFTGNHSPIVRPARHDWDIFSIPIQPSAAVSGTVPTQITHSSFYDMHSLDVAADQIRKGQTLILISTYGYPIGALIREYSIGPVVQEDIFQPHVVGEPQASPAYGEAWFIPGTMDILFLAATNTSGGDYDYNVFSMSEVTGSEIKQLTHLKGMTTQLRVLPDGRATFVNGGVEQVLNIGTQVVKPLQAFR